MPGTGKISELLLRWEELRNQGQAITPAELCRDYPAHLPEVERQIQALRAVYQVVETDSDQPIMPPRPAQDQAPPTETCDSTPPSGFAPAATLPGGPVIPGYEILEELGRGGMGVVYKARQIKLNRLVALKMILAGDLAGEQELARFRIEAEAVARLKHPNIVQIHEIGETARGPFFSLEFVEGGSLDKKIKGELLPHWQTAQLMETLARAMDVAHQHGIIHRDLKPQNILLTGDGQPKITDFGLAKRLDQEQAQTQTGTVMGTPSYMAPEQAEGKRSKVPIGPAADVYALGAILYELLTGRPPFKAETTLDTIMQVLSEEPVAPSRLQPEVPCDLETICLKCLHKEPEKRYGSARQLAEELRRFQEGKPVLARPAGARERLWRWCKRNPGVASLTAVVALLLVTAAIVATAAAFHFDRLAEKQGLLAQKEQRARADAEESARQNRRQELRWNIDQGWALYDGGDPAGALLWFARALEFSKDDPEVKRLNEMRVSTLLSQYPLHHIWFNVRHADLSPDGTRLVTASDDGTATVWSAQTGLRLGGPLRHRAQVMYAAFSPDGRKVVTASRDQTACIWEAATGKPLTDPLPHGSFVYRAVFLDNKTIVTAASDARIRTWQASTGKLLMESPRLGKILAFSPDTRWTVASAGENAGLAWDGMTGKSFGLKSQGNVSKATFSGDGRLLAVAWQAMPVQKMPVTEDEVLPKINPAYQVQVWDTDTEKAVCPGLAHRAPITSLDFSFDGRKLLTGCSDGRAQVWDLAKGKRVYGLEREGEVLHAAFVSPDNRVALVMGASLPPPAPKPEKIMPAPKRVKIKPGPKAPMPKVVFLHQPNCGGLGRGGLLTLVLTMLQAGEAPPVEAPRVEAPPVQPPPVQPPPTSAGSPLGGVGGPTAKAIAAAQASTGSALALDGPINNSLVIWEPARDGQPRTEPLSPWFSAQGSPADAQVVLNFNKGLLITANPDGTVETWKNNGEKSRFPLPHEKAVGQVSFNADGRLLLTVTKSPYSGGVARLWNLSQASQGRGLECETNGPSLVQFTADGKYILLYGQGTRQAWEAATGMPATQKEMKSLPKGLSRLLWVVVRYPKKEQKQIIVETGEEAMTQIPYLTSRLIPEFRSFGEAGDLDQNKKPRIRPPELPKLPPHRHFIGAFSPDFHRSVQSIIGSKHKGILICETSSGKALTPFMKHEVKVSDAAFSPDGRFLVSQARSTLRVWDSRTGEPITPPFDTRMTIQSFALSPAGDRLVAAGKQEGRPEGTFALIIWDLLPFSEISAAQLPYRTQVITGSWLDERGNLNRLGTKELQAAWEKVQRKKPLP